MLVTPPTAQRPPIVTHPGHQHSVRGTATALWINATDPEGQALTYSGRNLPPGLILVNSTGRISGTPSQSAAASYPVSISVSDGQSSTTVEFTWYITQALATADTLGNTAPVVASMAAQQTVQSVSVSLYLPVTDAQNHAISLTATGLPPGLLINSAQRRIQGSPSTVGSWNVTVQASDGQLSHRISFTWTVLARPSGVLAEYFRSAMPGNPAELALSRIDANINFWWGRSSPAPEANVPADGFSVRWTGCLIPRSTELHTLYLRADDGVRLWIDGRLVLDKWTALRGSEVSTTVSLIAGRPTPFRLEYFDASGSASCSLSWSTPTFFRSIITTRRLLSNEAAFPNAQFLLSAADEQSGAASMIPASAAPALQALPQMNASLRLVQNAASGMVDLLYQRPSGTGGSVRIQTSHDLKQWNTLTEEDCHAIPGPESSLGLETVRVAHACCLPGNMGLGSRQFRLVVVQ